MKRRGLRATIRFLAPSELAGKEKERLFAGLEVFANLGDTRDEYHKFANQWRTFFPIRILDLSQQSETPWETPCVPVGVAGNPPSEIWIKDISWDPACFAFVLAYRDHLRDLWANPDKDAKEESLQVLLGIDPDPQAFLDESRTPESVTETLNRFAVTDDGRDASGERCMSWGWHLVLKAYPRASPERFPPVWPGWGTGDFSFEPHNDLQRAVYLLFRGSWRAKLCARCTRYFIAQKPPQLYCSSKCYGEAKRSRDLKWWKREGAKRRRKRALIARRKGGK